MNKLIKIKVWHLLSVLFLVFLFSGIAGQGVGARLAKENIKKQESIIESLTNDNEYLQELIDENINETSNNKQQIKTFENEYRREKNLRIRLQSENAALRDAIFSYSQLDSIADHYRFERD